MIRLPSCSIFKNSINQVASVFFQSEIFFAKIVI